MKLKLTSHENKNKDEVNGDEEASEHFALHQHVIDEEQISERDSELRDDGVAE